MYVRERKDFLSIILLHVDMFKRGIDFLLLCLRVVLYLRDTDLLISLDISSSLH